MTFYETVFFKTQFRFPAVHAGKGGGDRFGLISKVLNLYDPGKEESQNG